MLFMTKIMPQQVGAAPVSRLLIAAVQLSLSVTNDLLVE
jgi:hypothetical protein